MAHILFDTVVKVCIMENIVDKISNYNLFNYLFPGVIYVVAVNYFTRMNLPTENLLEALFLCYFIGLAISRIGALIVEGLIRKIPHYPEEVLYEDFVEASKQDTSINVLSSERNIYRTTISLGIVILLTIALDSLFKCIDISEKTVFVLLIMVLVVLFIFAYIRQTKYIINRVKNIKK